MSRAESEEPSIRRSRLGLPLAITLLIVACGGKPAEAPGGRVVNITTARVERRDVEQVEWAVGRLESMAAPPVAAEVAGKVIRILADEGQSVERGQVLAELDSQQYRLGRTVDQAEVGRLQALVRNKQLEVARARRLIDERLISQEQLESVQTDFEALTEQLRGAQARAADSVRRLGEATIVAPFKGQISKRNVDVGEYVQVGAAAFEIIDLQNLRVRLPFPEYRATELRKGLPVRLKSSAGSGTVTATITDVQPSVNASNRSLSVIVDFQNPGHWPPGASVEAEVVLNKRPGALMVPQIAVVRRPSGDVIYIVDKGSVREQPVQRGARNGDRVEVLSGLKGGEVVAVDGAGFLTNGAGVNVVSAG